MTKAVHCDDCGTDATLTKDDYLRVSCECESVAIKVPTVLPEGWR